jgi:hypothetical protein
MTLTIDHNNSSENTDFLTKQEKVDSTNSLHEIAKSIPTLIPKAAGLGSTHHVTNSATAENELELNEVFENAKRNAACFADFGNIIRLFDIHIQDMLFEILKIAAEHFPDETCQYIQNYNIKDQNRRFEVAKIIAAESGGGINEYIQNFGITDQKMLVEIAKIAAAQRCFSINMGISEFIQNYGITDQKMLVEIAKIAAANSSKGTSRYIQNYGITDQDMLFEIAKIAAFHDGKAVSECIQNFGITDQNWLFEIAKISAANDGEGVSEYIQNFGITDQKMLFEIAKIGAAQSGSGTSAFILNFGITDQNRLFEIAKIAAAQNGNGTSQHLKKYGLSQGEQLQILQICLAQIASDALETNDFFTLGKFAKAQKVSSKKQLFETTLQICDLKIPFHFDTMQQEQKVVAKLKEAFKQLKDFAIQFGVRDRVLASLEKTIFTKHTSLLQQQKDLLWLGTWMMHYSFDPDEDALLKSPLGDEEMIPLLNSILKTTDPNLRSLATTVLTKGYPEKLTSLKTLMGADERLHLIVLFSTAVGIEPELTTKICDELYPSRKDAKLMAPINELMGALYKNSSLSFEEKKRLLGMTFHPPVKGNRESRPDFNTRLSQYRKSRQNWVIAVYSLLYFGQEEILKNVTNTTDLVKEWQTFIGKTFYIREDVIEKFFPTFGQSERYPNGLIIYATRLQTLAQEEKNQLMPLLGKFANSVLDGTFPDVRYSFTDNTHLETVFSDNEELLQKWRTSLPIEIDSQTTIEDTDHWEDLVMMGTEVEGSCQNIHNDPASNKCLLSSFLDGKIRLMVAREKSSGKIIGRVILRILLDENHNPVLFMEKLYTRNGVNEELTRQNIIEGCRQKAQSMGIALAASGEDYTDLNANEYPGALESLGGPAPYEYVDAIGDIAKGGIYSIPESLLLWSPSAL